MGETALPGQERGNAKMPLVARI